METALGFVGVGIRSYTSGPQARGSEPRLCLSQGDRRGLSPQFSMRWKWGAEEGHEQQPNLLYAYHTPPRKSGPYVVSCLWRASLSCG